MDGIVFFGRSRDLARDELDAQFDKVELRKRGYVVIRER